MTTSEEYAKMAEEMIEMMRDNPLDDTTDDCLQLTSAMATLSVAAAIREQTEQARENTLELACASRGVSSPHPTWYP